MIATTESRPSGSVVSAAAGCIVVLMCVAFWAARRGFETPVLPLLQVGGLGLFLVTGVELLRPRLPVVGRWYTTEGALAVVPLLLATLVSCVFPAAGTLVSLTGVVSFALALYRARGRPLVWLTAAVVLAGWCVGLAWGHGYGSPLFLESVAARTASQTIVDTLFHVSIANMLDVHGVSATGLDGVVPLHYHIGSHWLFVRLGRLAGLSPFDFYQLGFPVLFLPAVLASPLRFALSLRPLARAPSAFSWAVLSAGVIGVFPLAAQRGMAIGWWRPISESYSVSLVLAFGLASAAVAFCQRSDWQLPRAGDWSVRAFCLLVVPLTVAIIGVTKSSTMLLLATGFGFTFLRRRLFQSGIWWTSLVLTLALTFATLRLIQIPEFSQPSPLYFWRAYVHADWLVLWPLGYFAAYWLLLALRLRGLEPPPTWQTLKLALRSGRLFDLELVAVLMLVSCVPDALLAIPGQSGGYFSDLPRWLALALLLAWVIARGAEGRDQAVSQEASSSGAAGERWLKRVGTRALLLIAGGVCISNAAQISARFIRGNLEVRRALSGASPSNELAFLLALRALDAKPEAWKRQTALVVADPPPGLESVLAPCKRPFLWPALSGMAVLGALPSSACPFFGYWTYRDRPEGWNGPAPGLPSCARATALGFARVARLGRDAAGRPKLESGECGSNQP